MKYTKEALTRAICHAGFIGRQSSYGGKETLFGEKGFLVDVECFRDFRGCYAKISYIYGSKNAKQLQNGGSTGYTGQLDRTLGFDILFMRPDFWRAFAEAERWPETCCSGCGYIRGITTPECMASGRVAHDNEGETWLYLWHGFNDHVSAGGDIESYLKTLMPNWG